MYGICCKGVTGERPEYLIGTDVVRLSLSCTRLQFYNEMCLAGWIAIGQFSENCSWLLFVKFIYLNQIYYFLLCELCDSSSRKRESVAVALISARAYSYVARRFLIDFLYAALNYYLKLCVCGVDGKYFSNMVSTYPFRKQISVWVR